MEGYPAAEQMAASILIGDNLDAAMGVWREAYAAKFGREPSPAEVEAARVIIEARADGKAPPLSPSASSSCWRLPKLERGLPGENDR